MTTNTEQTPIIPDNPSEASRQALEMLTALVYYARTHPYNPYLDFLRSVALYTVYRPGHPPLVTVNSRGLEAAVNKLHLDFAIQLLEPRLPTNVTWPSDGLQRLHQLRAAALPV